MKTYITFILLLFSQVLFGQDVLLSIEIQNLNNTQGSVIIKVFYSEKAYDDDIPDILEHLPKKGNMDKGVLITQLNIPPGTVGIAFVDDENGNKEMDYIF